MVLTAVVINAHVSKKRGVLGVSCGAVLVSEEGVQRNDTHTHTTGDGER